MASALAPINALRLPSLFQGEGWARPDAIDFDPEEEESLIRAIKGKLYGGLATTGYALSTPGDYARGVLSGTPGERKSGREMLERWGALGPNRPGLDIGDVAGFAAELPTDPLFWLGGFLGRAVSGAGRIFQRAGVLTKGTEEAGLLRKVAVASGKLTPKEAEKAGPRLLNMILSGRNVMEHGIEKAARKKIEEDLLRAASKTGYAGDLPRILDQPLGGAVNLGALGGTGLPFSGGGPLATLGHGPLAQKYVKGLDWLGQGLRYSGPGRYAATLFNQRGSGGMAGEFGQRNMPLLAEQLEEAGAKASPYVQKVEMAQIAAGLDKPGGERAMTMLAETKDAELPAMINLLATEFGANPAAIPALRQAIQEAHGTYSLGEAAGTTPRRWRDEFAEYLGRSAPPGALDKGSRGMGRVVGTMTTERLPRSGYTENIRGATATLQALMQSKRLADLARMSPDRRTMARVVGEELDRLEKAHIANLKKYAPQGAVISDYTSPKYYYKTKELERIGKRWPAAELKAMGKKKLTADEVLHLSVTNSNKVREIADALRIRSRDRSKALTTMFLHAKPEARAAGYFVDEPIFHIKRSVRHTFENLAKADYIGRVAAQGLDDATKLAIQKGSRGEAIKLGLLKSVQAGEFPPQGDFQEALSRLIEQPPSEINPGWVPLDEVLKPLGLTGENRYQPVLKELGVQPGALTPEMTEIMSAALVRRDVADDLLTNLPKFRVPPEIGKLGKFVDKVTGMWTTGVTTHPAFSIRNVFGAKVKNLLEQMSSWPSERVAALLMKGGLPDLETIRTNPAIQAVAKTLGINLDTLTAQQARDLAARAGAMYNVASAGRTFAGSSRVAQEKISRTLEDWMAQYAGGMAGHGRGASLANVFKELFGRGTAGTWRARQWAPGGKFDIEKIPLVSAGRLANVYAETQPRMAAWLKLTSEGVDPLVARRMVDEKQFRYGKEAFTPFESKFLRGRLFPFYTFGKQAAADTMRTLAQAPGGRLGQLIRAQGQMAASGEDQGLVPEYISQSLSIPIPSGASGDPRYLTGFGLMHEQDPFGYMGGGARGALAEAGSRLNPMVKGLIEWMTGKSLFQRGPMGSRSLEDMDPAIGRLLRNIQDLRTGEKTREPVELPGWLEAISANLPTSRFVTTGRTLTDPRKSWTARLLNTLTGARITDVPERTQDALLRERVENLLRQGPGAEAFTRFFVPKAALAEMPPEDRLRAMQLQAIINRLAKKAKERAKKERK